jgi:hypothetical protein
MRPVPARLAAPVDDRRIITQRGEYSMRKRLASAIVATGAAAAAAVLLTATTALAAPTSWTASPGGAYTSSASGSSTLTDTTASQTITCTTETDAGTINATASGSPAVLGTITSSKFSSCTDGLGESGWSATSSGTWNINGYHFQGADGTGTTCANTGVTCGTITSVSATVTGKILGIACTFVVSGSVGVAHIPSVTTDKPVTYTNSSGILAVPNTPTLTVSGVPSGDCAGIIKNGDTAEFAGNFAVSPKQTITGTPAG